MGCESYSGGGADGGMPLLDQDLAYLKCLDDERIKLTGLTGAYYVHDRSQGNDPLYNEPVPWGYLGPYTFTGSLEHNEADDSDEMVDTEKGWEKEYDARLYISALEWDNVVGSPHIPKSSDVVSIGGRWWDVVKSSRNGPIVGTQTYVGWKLELKLRTKFDPSRKVP